MVLRRIFGPDSDEVTWHWRRLHNEELYDLYTSPNINLVFKSRRLTLAEHLARMREREERCIHVFGGETCRKKTTWKTQA